MKVFISSDIEGTAGITAWAESERGKNDAAYPYFCRQMTREVAAACQGALDAGAAEVLVKDAHETGRNLDPAALPAPAKVLRGWTGGPLCMVAGLDESYSAVAFTGYHSPSASDKNPLAHTMDNIIVDEVLINGKRASEFDIHSYAAGLLGVPVVFVSGDEALCQGAQELVPGITTVATLQGEGGATVGLHPDVAAAEIRAGMARALAGDLSRCLVPMPPHFNVTIRYKEHPDAYRRAFYPGAKKLDERTIGFESADYYEILRFFLFVL